MRRARLDRATTLLVGRVCGLPLLRDTCHQQSPETSHPVSMPLMCPVRSGTSEVWTREFDGRKVEQFNVLIPSQTQH